jgi:hypothetical protein
MSIDHTVLCQLAGQEFQAMISRTICTPFTWLFHDKTCLIFSISHNWDFETVASSLGVR